MASEPVRNRRNQSIRFAIFTSLLSKGSSMLLQFISLPLAARVLGREEFGIYATISLSVYMVAVLELGVGPALGRQIAAASAKGDRVKEGQLFLSGLVLVFGLAMAGAILAGVVISSVPLPVLFGEKYTPFVDIMRPALWLGVGLMAAQIVVEMTDRVREGYMEAGMVNAFGTAGNFVGAIVVFVGIRYEPSVSFLLLAVFGPNILARIASLIFLLRKRPWLVRVTEVPKRDTMTGLVKEGLSFAATSFLVYFIDYTVCALIVGRVAGPSDVAVFHVLMSITTAFTGLLIMVGRPLWAAIVDAMESEDHEWLSSVIRRYYLYLFALVASAALVLIVGGPWLIPFLYGDEFQIGRVLFVSHSILLLAIGWRIVNRYIMIGFGLLPKTVIPIMGGLALGLILGVPALKVWGLPGLLAGVGAGTLLIPGTQLPCLVRRAIKMGDKKAASTSA